MTRGYDKANQIYDEVKKHFQELVFKTVIQRNVKLSETPSYGLPTILYDAESTGQKNHLSLAKRTYKQNKINSMVQRRNAPKRTRCLTIYGWGANRRFFFYQWNWIIENIRKSQSAVEFDETALGELADSISEIGIIQPITLRKINEDEYQIIAGERRYRASLKAGLKSIPAYIRTLMMRMSWKWHW